MSVTMKQSSKAQDVGLSWQTNLGRVLMWNIPDNTKVTKCFKHLGFRPMWRVQDSTSDKE